MDATSFVPPSLPSHYVLDLSLFVCTSSSRPECFNADLAESGPSLVTYFRPFALLTELVPRVESRMASDKRVSDASRCIRRLPIVFSLQLATVRSLAQPNRRAIYPEKQRRLDAQTSLCDAALDAFTSLP